MRSGVVVATMMWSTASASRPADSSARRAAMSARSDEACSGAAMRRSRMPVRSTIQASEVSTMRSKSAFESTRSGTYMPVPAMVAPRGASGSGLMIRLDLLADVLVHAVLDERGDGADGAAERPRTAAAVTDEAHAVDPEQRGGPVLLGVQGDPHPPHRPAHEQRAEHGQRVLLDLLAHDVHQQPGDTLGGLEQHVPGEPVGDDDVGAAVEHVAPLDVADEVQVLGPAQQVPGLEDQLVALGLLLADREQA